MHHRWKHGERSKFNVGPSLLEHMQRVQDDPDLMTLRTEIVLLDALIGEKLCDLGDRKATMEEGKYLSDLFVDKAKLLSSEVKRQGEIGGTYTAERMFAIMGGLFEVVKELVEDGDKIAEIGRRFARVIGRKTLPGEGEVVEASNDPSHVELV